MEDLELGLIEDLKLDDLLEGDLELEIVDDLKLEGITEDIELELGFLLDIDDEEESIELEGDLLDEDLELVDNEYRLDFGVARLEMDDTDLFEVNIRDEEERLEF